MNWRKLLTTGRVSPEEYGANLAGMNTFFGAVIGFVLADVDTKSPMAFAQLLLVTSGIVISILYVSASRHRWVYAALTLLLIWSLPAVVRAAPDSVVRLQITLTVWTVMTIFLELLMLLNARANPPDKPS